MTDCCSAYPNCIHQLSSKYLCDWTDNPVCPHCGYVERDAWEIDFGAGLDGDNEVNALKAESERLREVVRKLVAAVAALDEAERGEM
mgnify:CR=1 FL=1